MQSFNYAIKHACASRRRQLLNTVKADLSASFYFFLLGIASHLLFFIRSATNVQATIVQNETTDWQSVSTNPQLLVLLSGLQVAFLVMFCGIALFGSVYFFIALQRSWLLNQPMIKLKHLNGGSLFQVTLDFWLEQVLGLPLACLLGFFIAEQVVSALVRTLTYTFLLADFLPVLQNQFLLIFSAFGIILLYLFGLLALFYKKNMDSLAQNTASIHMHNNEKNMNQ